MMINNIRRFCLAVACIAVIALVVGVFKTDGSLWQPSAVVLAVSFAIGIGAIPSLKNYQYTAWIITAVVAGMIYPMHF